MNWTDIYDIAIALEEKYPSQNILQLKFTDLKLMIISLTEFKGASQHCNEKILEAIQAAWLEERE